MAKPKILKKGYNERITRLDFSSRHYRGAQFQSDMFYVGVANRLLPELKSSLDGFRGLKPTHLRRLALTLVCYIEDLVSGSGIWEAFLSLHKKKYGRDMPFYDTDDELFSREFPSLQAVRFLMWYTLNDVEPDIVLNPTNPALELLAIKLMPTLLEAYDDAPDSPGRPEIVPEETLPVPIFYQIRNICDWLCRGCYLTAVTDIEDIEDSMFDYLEPIFDDMDASEDQIGYGVASYLPFNLLIGPLGITAQEWLTEIISLYPEESERELIPILSDLKSLPYKAYLCKSVSEDRKTALLTDIDGNEYNLSAYTMPDEVLPANVTEESSSMISMVYFNGAWNLNSIGMQGLPAEFFNKLSKQINDNRKAEAEKYSILMKRLKNKPIGSASDFEELKEVLGLPEKEIPETDYAVTQQKNYLFFVNSNSDVSILPGFGPAVKFRGNKLYDKAKAATDGLALVFNPSISSEEMRNYIIENRLIPDAALNSFTSPEDGHRLFQENLRFFADYARRGTPLYASN